MTHCRTCAPEAWTYPVRGVIYASCGDKLQGSDLGELLSHWEWEDGDLVEVCGCYCPWCALHLKVSGRLAIATEARRAETVQLGSVHEGAGPQGHRPTTGEAA